MPSLHLFTFLMFLFSCNIIRSSYIIDLERGGKLFPTHCPLFGSFFVCIYNTACMPPRPLSEVVRYSGAIIIYGDISWYIEQRPLFGRRLLLGVSIKRESTV